MKFNNEYLTSEAIKCPSPQLKCALDEFLEKNTSLDLAFDTATRILTVTVNGVVKTITIPV